MSEAKATADIAGHVAVITGGARGIGLEISRRLAVKDCRVVLFDIDAAGLDVAKQSFGNSLSVTTFAVDLTSTEQVTRAVDRVVHDLGRVDILVNNAGIVRDKRFLQMTDEDWDSVITTNLRSQFVCCRAVLAGMCERHYGRIVNISSRAWLGGFGQANYSAAKGGVISLTRTLAIEFASKGVTVNAIAPGIIDTPMFRGFRADVRERLKKSVPAGRVGTPADIAAAVEFFVSPQAAYITGQTLYVCGGRSLSSPNV